MDFKRLGNILMLAGTVVLAAAMIWWFVFYTSVIREVGRASGGQGEGSVVDAVSCIYSASGFCGLVSGVATLAGRTAYEPMVFWFGLAGLILGIIIRATAKPTGAS